MSKYLVFSIAGEECGIELSKVSEIIRPQKTTPFPGVPKYINGIINLRGVVMPLMDLRKRLGVKSFPKKERIIIVSLHNEKIGLMVDSVNEITNIDDNSISSPPAIFRGIKPEYLNGIGRISERLIILLNLDNLLTSEEIMLIGDISEASPLNEKGGNEAD